MKNNRIWMVILLILVVGGLSTVYTRHYISGQENLTVVMRQDAEEHPVREGAAESFGAAPSDIAVGVEEAMAAGGQAAELIPDMEAPANKESAPAVMAAPAAGKAVAAAEPDGLAIPEDAVVATETAANQEVSEQKIVEADASQRTVVRNGFVSRLEELDAQIEKNRSAEREGNANYTVKSRVENERKLWETELDGIVDALRERLGTGQKEALIAEQREWYRMRESRAIEASKKQSGSSLEEVEYTISVAASTRERAYELVKAYEAVLN